MTLFHAAKVYLIYLRAIPVHTSYYEKSVRALRDVLTFYGYDFPLTGMIGSQVLLYTDQHDPFDFIPDDRLKGQVFWKFVHFLKKNEMIQPGR